ncbi:unnamed protein product [Candidula unifasciata]|uniref:Uncharacterized protein n=1 Tax=Candidula unifasciata TaxID=100452 RepID=A0A8S3YVN6_9EUPU|nr:unnamed protein product [Candidula unifasciata]
MATGMWRLLCCMTLLFTAVASQANTSSSDWVKNYLDTLSQAKKANTILPSQLVFQFKHLEFEWPCEYVKEFYQEKGLYDPLENVLAGIDVYNNDTFVTVYRTSEKVSSGSNKLVVNNGMTSLQPFPNLTMNQAGKCSNLQFPIKSITDPNSGCMYIIDIGSVKKMGNSSEQTSTSGNTTQPCPPKLVVLDLKKNGTIVRSHDLAAAEPRSTSYLKDITLDYGDRNNTQVKHAYITDSGNQLLIVFNFDTNTSHSFAHDSMKSAAQQTATSGSKNAINSITVDSEFKFVYYNCLGSQKISQIPTAVLQDSLGDFATKHRYVGNTTVASGSVVCGKKGLYFASVNTSSVYRWNITQDIEVQNATKETVTMKNQTVIFKNGTGDYNIEGLALDSSGYLWLTQSPFILDSNNTKGINFKIYRLSVNDTNILCPDSVAPPT